MRGQPVRVEHARVRGEYVARRPPWPQLGRAGVERLTGCGVVGAVQRLRPADDVRAHDRGVIVAADAGEFERDLVVGVELRRPLL